MSGIGGYEDGYRRCVCFWGRTPGSLVRRLVETLPTCRGLRVLDVGCGEGKNAAYLAQQGASVVGIDICDVAIANARAAWGDKSPIELTCGDVRNIAFDAESFDIVIAYGLMHCLDSEAEVRAVVERLQRATRRGGWNVLCTFNDRYQELHAHPGLIPTLLPHSYFLDCYESWRIKDATDLDLHEVHPTNGIEHVHSMTRILAQRGLDAHTD